MPIMCLRWWPGTTAWPWISAPASVFIFTTTGPGPRYGTGVRPTNVQQPVGRRDATVMMTARTVTSALSLFRRLPFFAVVRFFESDNKPGARCSVDFKRPFKLSLHKHLDKIQTKRFCGIRDDLLGQTNTVVKY